MSSWTVEQVVKWAREIIGDVHPRKLKEQEVDGPAIKEMAKKTQEQLETKFTSHPYNFPDGPATKLAAAISSRWSTHNMNPDARDSASPGVSGKGTYLLYCTYFIQD